jgi:hypothetical protein
MVFFFAPGCSFRFSGIVGAEVYDAQNGSSRRCFAVWLCLAAKPSHVGVDVNGLAYSLHRPTTYSHQMRGQGLFLGAILSCHCSGQWHLFGGCEAPKAWIFGGVLTIWIPALPNLTWGGKSFLPRDAYPMTEPSWRLDVYP